MSHRDRTFVSYAREDIGAYWAMRGWPHAAGIPFDFHDAHDLALGSDSSPRDQRRSLRERLAATRQFVVLVGTRSRTVADNPRGFFALELDVIRSLDVPVIFVNLNGARHVDTLRLPLALSEASSISVPFEPAILRHALDDFTVGVYPRAQAFFYPSVVYAELGI
ncbi:MAG: hypothetical protein QOG77_3069 [Solirubrobacteraceae bacterium]|jgi:hypothetical protein|nr:hypothetical protein [Solirubrobacteraceae bacterium]